MKSLYTLFKRGKQMTQETKFSYEPDLLELNKMMRIMIQWKKDPQFKERVNKVVEEHKKIMEKYKFKSTKHFLLSSFNKQL